MAGQELNSFQWGQFINGLIQWGEWMRSWTIGILDFFAGRPKQEATVQSAQTATKHHNPAIRIYGVQLARMVKEWGIVTSDSNPGRRKILDAAFSQAIHNAEALGYPRLEFTLALDWVLSTDGQGNIRVPPILDQVPPNQANLWGPPKVQATRDKAIELAHKKGLLHEDFDRYVETYTWQHSRLTDLFHVIFVKQGDIPPLKCSKGYEWNYSFEVCTPKPHHGKCPTGFVWNDKLEQCDPIVPPSPQNCPPGTTWSVFWNACLPDPIHNKCPPGYFFNVQTEKCDPEVPPPPPACPAGQEWNVDYQQCVPIQQSQNCPPGFVYNTATGKCDPLGPQPGPQDPCCEKAVTQLAAIAQTLADIAATVAADSPNQGFSDVVAAIGDVTLELTNILDTITIIANQPPPAPIDLQPITAALTALGLCVCALPGLVSDQTVSVTDALDAIADNLAALQSPDLTGVVDQLKAIDKTLEPFPGIYTQLANDGFLPADFAQTAGAHGLGSAIIGVMATSRWTDRRTFIKYWLGIDIGA